MESEVISGSAGVDCEPSRLPSANRLTNVGEGWDATTMFTDFEVKEIPDLMSEPLFDESQYAEQDRAARGAQDNLPLFRRPTPLIVSHTSADSLTCKRWILHAIERAVSAPVFLAYNSFSNSKFRDVYARQILVDLRCSEHLVVVLSGSAMSSLWVQEEVSWW
jgi:hypothetical protein